MEEQHLLAPRLTRGIIFSGHIPTDVYTFLDYHNNRETAYHSEQVAREAGRIAALFGIDSWKAEVSGWLHDCSAIFPYAERVQIARKVQIPVLPEEDSFPMIIHQKLSGWLAETIFGIDDPAILSAISCHTTLKAHASTLDKVVFVADKIAWDQEGIAPYHTELLAALDQSLDQAAFVYLEYMWKRRDSLKVLHPWLKDAYLEIKHIVA